MAEETAPQGTTEAPATVTAQAEPAKEPAKVEAKVEAKAEPAKTEPAKSAWPEDWVSRVARGDEKRINNFKKFASPEALADSYDALRAKMDSGQVKSTLPKDAKPEELSAWRKDHGIPDKHDGYDLKGIEIPDTDKEIVNGFLERLHKVNASPELVREAIAGYYEQHERQVEARAARDEEDRQKTSDILNQEWGAQFRRNVNMMEGLLSKFPAGVRDAIKSARLPDGTALFNSPDALRGFISLALEINPVGIVTPGGTGDIPRSALEEYNEIRKTMRTDRNTYNKDAKMQSRMTELIDYLMKNEMIDSQGNEIQKKKAA